LKNSGQQLGGRVPRTLWSKPLIGDDSVLQTKLAIPARYRTDQRGRQHARVAPERGADGCGGIPARRSPTRPGWFFMSAPTGFDQL
jgi:hypothetical protein